MSDHFRRDVLKRIGGAAALATAGTGVSAAAPPAGAGGPPSEGPTVVDIAGGVNRFSTLVAAVDRAGLVGALSGNRQLTVFAPNNAAFQALLEALGADGLGEIPVGTLRAVLLYHVIPGRRKATSVVNVSQVPTLQGTEVAVAGTRLNPDGEFPASIIEPNLAEASNGIVHEIDGVLNPSDQA
jgi:uncharacterized surface protein with fasciclin (FAS1) repeats